MLCKILRLLNQFTIENTECIIYKILNTCGNFHNINRLRLLNQFTIENRESIIYKISKKHESIY